MKVLHEILEWSHGRPVWQRDALRRLVLNGALFEDDILALAEMCKAAHGLAEQQKVLPLAKHHVPTESDVAPPVSLVSIFHHRGVNALAEGQTLMFGSGLTVVYGDNAAGKTGYIRILKSACRARGQEIILNNIISGSTPLTPVVAIKYKVGVEQDPLEWTGRGEDEFISRVSVFDTHCAAVYLTEKTDVAFRPFGLDLFDNLVRACKAVRKQLEKEQRALASSTLATVQAQVPEGTAAARLLANITSLTKPEAVRQLSRLKAEEESRLALLEKSLLDLQAKDPEKLIQQLTLRAERVQALARHIRNVEAVLSEVSVDAVFNIRTEGRRKSKKAKTLREATFSPEMLAATGSESWIELWESARSFSQEFAYPDQHFPVVENGAHCVLCQQDLDHAAQHRLKQFESFVTSTTEKELRQARQTFAHRRKTFTDLKVTTDVVDATIKEIRIEQEAVSDAIMVALATAEGRRKAVVLALSENFDLAPDCPILKSVAAEVDALADQITERVKTLRTPATVEKRNRMVAEAQELRARYQLKQHEKIVLNEIERKRKYAAYGLCMNDTRTQAITQKSSAVTRNVVTQKLKQSFQNELSNLAFHHIEVELKESWRHRRRSIPPAGPHTCARCRIAEGGQRRRTALPFHRRVLC